MDEGAKETGCAPLLIVESDERQRSILADVIGEEGFDVICCARAGEALEYLRDSKISVALLNLRLADLDKNSLLQKLRCYRDRVRFIAYASCNSSDAVQNMTDVGAFVRIEKTEDLKELALHVHRAWRDHLYSYVKELEREADRVSHDLQAANEGLKYESAEHRKAEEALRVLDFSIDNASFSVFQITPEGRFTYVNKTACRSLGLTREELMGKTVTDIDPNYPLGSRTEHWQKLRNHGTLTFETVHIAKNGRRFPVEVTEHYLRFGDTEYEFAYAIDISHRKHVTDALSESNAQLARQLAELHQIYETSPVGLCLLDNDLRCVRINEILARSHGRAAEEYTGKSIWEALPYVAEIMAPICRQVIDSGQPILNCEIIGREPSDSAGQRFWLAHYHPVKDGTGQVVGVNAVVQDITERKNTEKRIQYYQQQLKSSASQLSIIEERAKKKIAMGLHDNIGQGLAMTKFELQSLARSCPDVKVSKTLDSICGDITRMIEEIQSLVFELNNPLLSEFGIKAALEKYMTKEVEARFGIKCKLMSTAETKDMEEAARVVLYRSARELLTNVVKHAKARNVEIHIYEQGGNLMLSVEDDGTGFDVHKQKFIPTRKGRLGLFSIREQLEYQGGGLQVESEPGRGTKATMSIPVCQKQQADV